MLKFSKNNDKGITMIALTITVIVLLILASITLAQLTDDNSVVKKAQESKNKTESAQKYENETTSNILATIPTDDNSEQKADEVHICVRDSGTITTFPTCTNKGIISYKCTICSKVLETEEVPAKGHSPKPGVANPDATCTETGKRIFGCYNCSEILAEEVIPAKGHSVELTNIVAATCTENGYKKYECSADGCTYSFQIPLKALGHDYQETVIQPTCTENGYTLHKCSRCNSHYTSDEVGKTGVHTWENGICKVCKEECEHLTMNEYAETTFDHDGYEVEALRNWDKCSVCGVYVENKSNVDAGDGNGNETNGCSIYEVHQCNSKCKVKTYKQSTPDGELVYVVRHECDCGAVYYMKNSDNQIETVTHNFP